MKRGGGARFKHDSRSCVLSFFPFFSIYIRWRQMKHLNVQLAHFLDRRSVCDRWLASIHVDYVILTDGLQHTVYAPALLTRHTKACARTVIKVMPGLLPASPRSRKGRNEQLWELRVSGLKRVSLVSAGSKSCVHSAWIMMKRREAVEGGEES